MRRSIVIVLLCIPHAASSAGHPRVEIGPMLGMRMGGSIAVEDRAFRRENLEVGIGASASFGFRLGIPISERFEFEGLLSHQSTVFKDQAGLFGERPGGFFEPGDRSFLDLGITSYQAGLLWKFHQGWSELYLAAGAGMSRIRPSLDLPATTRLSINGGAGTGIALNDHLGLKAEWRTYWIDTDETATAVVKYSHRDCIDPCTYTYQYRPSMTQGELSLGLMLRF